MSIAASLAEEHLELGHIAASTEDNLPLVRSTARINVWHRILKLLSGIVEGPITHYSNALREAPLCTKAITSCIVALLGEIIGAALKSKRRADRRGNRVRITVTSDR